MLFASLIRYLSNVCFVYVKFITHFGWPIDTWWSMYASFNWAIILVEVVTCHLFGAESLAEPMVTFCQLDPVECIHTKLEKKCIYKCPLHNVGHSFVTSVCKAQHHTSCRLCVIYVREDNDSSVQIMITRLVWTTWTPLSTVPKRLLNLITRLCILHSQVIKLSIMV